MSTVVDLAGRALWPVVSAVKEIGTFYTEINPATLSGAIDIIVIKQKNGDLSCSPFHVRFGKLKLLRPSDKVVELVVNEKKIDIPMKVGEAGEAFFVIEAENPVSSEYATSPIIPPVHMPVESELVDFNLNSKLNSSAIDPTFSDIQNYLHIGQESNLSKAIIELPESNEKYQSLTEQVLPKDENENDLAKSEIAKDELPKDALRTGREPLPKDIVGGATYSQSPPILLPASSPPWDWQWGALPHRKSKDQKFGDLSLQEQGRLNNRASFPVMGRTPDPNMTIGYKEKVSQYLDTVVPPVGSPNSALSTSPQDLFLAIEQELDDDQVCYSIVGAESPVDYITCSTCGPLSEFQKLGIEDAENLFLKNIIDYEAVCLRPEVLVHPTSIYKIYGYYHNWNTAGPIIMSKVLFQRPLSNTSLRGLLGREGKTLSSGTSWFSWGSRTGSGRPIRKPPVTGFIGNTTPSGLKYKASDPGISLGTFDGDSGKLSERSTSPTPFSNSGKLNYAKSLRLTSEQLKTLDLKPGANTVQFSVVSGFQGKAVCSSKIYLWDYDAKIVISDVDGTITKSDVLGHVFTMVGRDWTHAGVANLYTNISKNGYNFLYLTSRAIGQAGYTREYLAKVEQDTLKLPEGPVLLSPDRLVHAFTREVIQRRPQEFKMHCLKDVKRLFGAVAQPFYAGFGNRISDAMSYRSVDIPSSRIFTIDPSGEVKLELLANFKTTYLKLNETVDQVFPPTTVMNPEYSDFHFWRSDFSNIDIVMPDGTKTENQNQIENADEEVEEGSVDSFSDQKSITSTELREHLSAMRQTSF